MDNEFFNYYALSDSVKADILRAIEKTLVKACLEGYYEVLANIIDNVNEPSFINKTHKVADLFDIGSYNTENYSYKLYVSFNLLTIAAIEGQEGHCDIIDKLLMVPEIDPNVIDSSGKTALIHHIQNHDYNDCSMLESLLNHKLTNVYIMDHKGFTALDYSKKTEINNLIKKRMIKDFAFLPVPNEVLMNIMDFYVVFDANKPNAPIDWEAFELKDSDKDPNYEEFSDYESDF